MRDCLEGQIPLELKHDLDCRAIEPFVAILEREYSRVERELPGNSRNVVKEVFDGLGGVNKRAAICFLNIRDNTAADPEKAQHNKDKWNGEYKNKRPHKSP